MSELDIHNTAREMMRLHGPGADALAWREADKMLSVWDIDGFHAWKRIMEVIRATPLQPVR